MKYDNITKAVFLNRQNRFIAEVELDGRIERVHVKNTGRCKELLLPGSEVWLTAPGTEGRKTKYDLVAVRKGNGVLFNIDSLAPNKVMKEWLQKQDYSRVVPEYTYGDSRIDFYMERDGELDDVRDIDRADELDLKHDEKLEPARYLRRDMEPEVTSDPTESYAPRRCLMEVKGCTLEIDGIGYFPDAPTQRGVKHIRELIRAKEEGYHAILAFVIQMDGVKEVRPNISTHPEFGEAMEDARRAGVRIAFYTCHVEPGSLEIIAESDA